MMMCVWFVAFVLLLPRPLMTYLKFAVRLLDFDMKHTGVIECKGLEIQPIRAKELECLMANQSRSPGGMQHVPPSFLVISFNNAVWSA